MFASVSNVTQCSATLCKCLQFGRIGSNQEQWIRDGIKQVSESAVVAELRRQGGAA